MSTKAPVKTQAKTSAAPAAARTPQPPVAEPEQEAVRPDIAAQLEGAARLGHSLGAVGVDSPAPPIIQRQEMPEEEEEELQLKWEPAAIQRQELPEEEEEELMLKLEEGRAGPQGGQVPREVEAAIRRARGGGQPLEGALQEQMSASLDHDFSRVRVHTDSEADQLNQELQAKAFTTGPDIFFKRGAYEPDSSGGRELIAHELTHVVQQSSGRVREGGSGMTVRSAGEAFEREADGVAEAVTRSINISEQRHRPAEAEYQIQVGAAETTEKGERHTGAGADGLETGSNSAGGGGQSLKGAFEKSMEPGSMAEFRDGGERPEPVDDSHNLSPRANPFTTGQAIYFKRAAYALRPSGCWDLTAKEMMKGCAPGVGRAGGSMGGIWGKGRARHPVGLRGSDKAEATRHRAPGVHGAGQSRDQRWASGRRLTVIQKTDGGDNVVEERVRKLDSRWVQPRFGRAEREALEMAREGADKVRITRVSRGLRIIEGFAENARAVVAALEGQWENEELRRRIDEEFAAKRGNSGPCVGLGGEARRYDVAHLVEYLRRGRVLFRQLWRDEADLGRRLHIVNKGFEHEKGYHRIVESLAKLGAGVWSELEEEKTARREVLGRLGVPALSQELWDAVTQAGYGAELKPDEVLSYLKGQGRWPEAAIEDWMEQEGLS